MTKPKSTWQGLQRAASVKWRRINGKVRRAKNRFDATRPGRTLERYGLHNGNVLAGGIAYYSLASIAAGVIIGATAASVLADAVPSLRESIFRFVGALVPGVVGDDGLVDADTTLVNSVAGIVGVIALLALVNTATRFIGALRTGVRTMLGRKAGNAFEAKARDLAAVVAIAVIVVVGLALQVAGSRAATWLSDEVETPWVTTWVVRVPAIGVGLVVDMLFVALALLVLGRARTNWRRLWPVLLVAGIVIGVLRQASSAVVANSVDNPVLGPFAAVVTLLAFVELTTRVILHAAAWLGAARSAATGGVVDDEGPRTLVDLSPARRRSQVTTARASVRRRFRAADARAALSRRQSRAQGARRPGGNGRD